MLSNQWMDFSEAKKKSHREDLPYPWVPSANCLCDLVVIICLSQISNISSSNAYSHMVHISISHDHFSIYAEKMRSEDASLSVSFLYVKKIAMFTFHFWSVYMLEIETRCGNPKLCFEKVIVVDTVKGFADESCIFSVTYLFYDQL